MAFTVAEFMDYCASHRDDQHEQVKCAKCQVELREGVTGFRPGPNGPRCSDCFYDDLSDALEKYPIGMPSVRR